MRWLRRDAALREAPQPYTAEKLLKTVAAALKEE